MLHDTAITTLCSAESWGVEGMVMTEGQVNLQMGVETIMRRPGKEIDQATFLVTKPKLPMSFMDLPTEIRLEIYRLCLKRPRKILLAGRDKSAMQLVSSLLTSTDTDTLPAERVANNRIVRSRPLQRQITGPLAGCNNMQQVLRRQRLRSRAAAMGSHYPMALLSSHRGSSSRRAKHDHYTLSEDPLITPILRTSKQIYKEARDVLYGENTFDLDLCSAVQTLACLHQRSRAQIQRVEVVLGDELALLNDFSELMRLSLRYCSGLKTLVVNLEVELPEEDGGEIALGRRRLYVSAFECIRFLPQGCQVELKGAREPILEEVLKRRVLGAGV